MIPRILVALALSMLSLTLSAPAHACVDSGGVGTQPDGYPCCRNTECSGVNSACYDGTCGEFQSSSSSAAAPGGSPPSGGGDSGGGGDGGMTLEVITVIAIVAAVAVIAAAILICAPDFGGKC